MLYEGMQFIQLLLKWIYNKSFSFGRLCFPDKYERNKALGKIIVNLSVFFFLSFLGPPLWHVDVPRLGVESEL